VDQEKKAVAHFWKMALESLSSAKREFEERAFHTVANRIYYAAFYSVTAMMLERGKKFSKHAGLRTAFYMEYIKTGLIDKKWGSVYDRFFDDRLEGDYIAFISFEHSYIKESLALCEEFINKVI
jgi:hypothetical protein